ncbi:O-acetyl-ADP-ribose deacetylase macrod1 [Linnemannia hyalina]|uniref:O-acetyl-ADP-ribose deacetylase macrod1 n=1 Tax=Linnemannia hyalina TaxID=64524 RepID=A0A9P8BMR6_9FUNG|nr:O-acetyl-ADP-ribose deacetylase macrod1 [Linnemannia hyalina]
MGKQQKNDGNDITILDDIPTLEECYGEYPKPNKVNAANESLLGGGGIDGAIHRAAGRELLVECRTLRGCPTGEAKSTKAYRLPSKSKNIFLSRCSEASVLEIVKDEKLKSIAFCCISTGIYGYDNKNAAEVALKTVRDWMDSHPNEAREIERVVFCVFLDKDVQIYETLLPRYFPKDEGQSKPSDTQQETSSA